MWWIIALFVLSVAAWLWDIFDSSKSKGKPEVPPRPEWQGSYEHCVDDKMEHRHRHFSRVRFPDGKLYTLDSDYTTLPNGKFRKANLFTKNYIPVENWTPPMAELFLLLTKDWRNWTEVYSKYYGSCHRHNSLSVSIHMENSHGDKMWYSSLSIPTDMLQTVIDHALIWKDITYGAKLRRIGNIGECKRRRILLEKQKKEATMITQYLENKGK